MGIDPIAVRAVFLDRDGVINRNVYNPSTGAFESPLAPEDVLLHDNVIPALQALRSAGYLLILVSNQPNYAKGKASMATLEAIHRKVFAPIEAAHIDFAEIHYCFHHPQGVVSGYSGICECRKPSPKFLLDDQRKHHINLNKSWMVGDRDADIQCGSLAGTRTIRVRSDHASGNVFAQLTAEFEARDLLEASRKILDSSA